MRTEKTEIEVGSEDTPRRRMGHHPLVGNYTFEGTFKEHVDFRKQLDDEWKRSAKYVAFIAQRSAVTRQFGF